MKKPNNKLEERVLEELKGVTLERAQEEQRFCTLPAAHRMSVSALAMKLEVSRATVKKAVVLLEKKGAVGIDRRRDKITWHSWVTLLTPEELERRREERAHVDRALELEGHLEEMLIGVDADIRVSPDSGSTFVLQVKLHGVSWEQAVRIWELMKEKLTPPPAAEARGD